MAKKENSATKEWWKIEIKDSSGAFRKQMAEAKKALPLDNKKEMEKGDGFIKVSVKESDNGKVQFCLEIPARYIELFEAIASGERKPSYRLDSPPETDLAKRALLGEFELLISHFERGGKLTDKERRILAKIARGKLPRTGRPPETKTELRNRDMVRFVKILRASGGKRVVDVAAKKFGVDRSYFSKLEKKYPRAAVADYLLGSLLTLFGADAKTAWRARLASAGVNEDDIREAAGRKQARK